MGTWDVSLYGNDTARDLRDDFRSVVKAPWGGDRLLQWAIEKYPSAADPTDTDYTDLRLVFADLLWTYGIEHPPTFELARAIVADGSDLGAKRALGMDERGLARRAKVLEGLLERWRAPNPKPRARNIAARPERFVLEVGDCMVYPLSQGKPRNPYVGPRQEERFYAMYPWRADGWGASIVLGRYHKYESFARYAIAVLACDRAAQAAAGTFGSLSILHIRSLQRPPTTRRVHAGTTSVLHLKRMQVEVVGRLAIDPEKVAAEFGPELRQFRRYGDEASFASHFDLPPLSTVIPTDDPISKYLATPGFPKP